MRDGSLGAHDRHDAADAVPNPIRGKQGILSFQQAARPHCKANGFFALERAEAVTGALDRQLDGGLHPHIQELLETRMIRVEIELCFLGRHLIYIEMHCHIPPAD